MKDKSLCEHELVTVISSKNAKIIVFDNFKTIVFFMVQYFK